MSGTEGAWVPLVLSAVGTGASVYAQQQAADDKRAILNRQMLENNKASEKSAQMVLNEGENYRADDRQQALDTEADKTYQQSTQDLGAAPTIIDTAGDAGAVSGDFLNAKADKAISEGSRLTALAKALSKTRAPGQLMTKEGLRRADLTGELGSIWGSQRNQSNAAGMDADGVEEPWWGAAGKIASSAAGAYGGGSASAGTGYGLSTATTGSAPFGDFAGSGSSLGAGAGSTFWNGGGSRIRFGG